MDASVLKIFNPRGYLLVYKRAQMIEESLQRTYNLLSNTDYNQLTCNYNTIEFYI